MIITDQNAYLNGISTKHEIMDNGQKRYRLTYNNVSTYIRSESPNENMWENSHMHSTIYEMYVIQEGMIFLAEYIDEKLVIKRYCTNEYCVSTPGIPHNTYIIANSIVHIVKFGDISTNDWIPCERLDDITKKLTFDNIIDFYNSNKTINI